MNVTPYISIVNKKDLEVTLTISGDIGYNYWADTYEDYKKNTSEAMAKELQAIKDIKATTINVEIESLGGDVFHGLAIVSLLKQSGATINVYYRGANASMSTVIGSGATTKDNIYMDELGLFLIHKPMSGGWGNSNDLKEIINSMDKVQVPIEKSYLNLGVKQSDLDDLIERNGGHGEWLTFEEAKGYGFIGHKWETEKISNYNRTDFSNRKILIPNNLINNQKQNEMAEMTTETKTGLFQEFKNWFKNEKEAEDKATELETLKAENESLKAENETLTTENESLKVATEEAEESTESTTETTEEVAAEEVLTEEQIIENKVEERLKAIAKQEAKPVSTKTVTNKTKEIPLENWEAQLQKHKILNKR